MTFLGYERYSYSAVDDVDGVVEVRKDVSE
jgi:hypothetical protein